jgi:hypothetical protein
MSLAPGGAAYGLRARQLLDPELVISATIAYDETGTDGCGSLALRPGGRPLG